MSDKITAKPKVNSQLTGYVSDYGAAWIAEGLAFAGLCIGAGLSDAWIMWVLVLFWAFSFGPKRKTYET